MILHQKTGSALAAFIILLTALGGMSAFASESLMDADISYWVRDAIRNDPRVDASAINVSSDMGVVTLSGSVSNLAARQYADLEAKKIKGVVGVINEITVDPIWRSDADIRYAVRRRILDSAGITSEGIRVSVNDGKVVLAGEVSDWGEAQQAGLLASEVPGVRMLTNEIVSVRKDKRSDQAIKHDAIAALQRDVYLSGLPIDVTINDGVITLAGSVGSVFESDRATQRVRRISNVKGVVNTLKIEKWEDRHTRKKSVLKSDNDLKLAVREELDQDPRIIDADIRVRAHLGSITLDGTVNSYHQMRIAGQDANNVVGVGWVVNNLLVRSSTRSSGLLQDDIAFHLDTDYALQGFQIKSTVNNGIVTLTGEVHNGFEKYHAGDIAAGIRGVRKVINRIVVLQAARAKSDQALANDIVNAFQWNWTTWPVRENIKVSVKDGIATLKGVVDTWSERREAARVAHHVSGIWAVDNQLKVRGYNYPWNKLFKGNKSAQPASGDNYPYEIPYYYDYPFWWDNS